MRWVPINPLVDAPQMKKLPLSSQKLRYPAASRSAPMARRNGFGAGGRVGTTAAPPYGARPRSAGRSRIRSNTGRIMPAATTAIVSETARQP